MTEQNVICRAEVERRTSLSKASVYRLLHAGNSGASAIKCWRLRRNPFVF